MLQTIYANKLHHFSSRDEVAAAQQCLTLFLPDDFNAYTIRSSFPDGEPVRGFVLLSRKGENDTDHIFTSWESGRKGA